MTTRPRSTRAAFVTQWFSPEPTIVPDGIALALKKGGARVEVLTGVPNYPTGLVPQGYSAARTRRDLVHGLHVRRAPLYPSHDQSPIRRILNYVSWAVSASIYGLPMLRRASVVVVYGSPITAALPALMARLVWRRPFVLIVQDVWPDSVFATGFLARGHVFRVAQACLTAFTNLVYRRAAKVVVISEGMKSLLVDRRVPAGKVEVIYNWVDHPEASPAESRNWRSEWGIPASGFVVMYAGNHGPAQALSSVVEAMASLAGLENVHLVLVGDGVEKQGLMKLAGQLAPEHVHFADAVPRDQMLSLMKAANVQLVALASEALFKVTIPSKLQAVMAAGHPVLVVAAGDSAHIVTEAGCGAAAAPGVVPDIARAIRELHEADPNELERMGACGRSFYDDHMSEQVGVARYAQVLDDVLREGD